ncbi:hypothetical protein, partial [Capnocytophaga sputigena]|uniref:hypothetical protein n=1 Tax=Capnocytophaga sputigena TaxID=1019 RepID=UPI00288A9154
VRRLSSAKVVNNQPTNKCAHLLRQFPPTIEFRRRKINIGGKLPFAPYIIKTQTYRFGFATFLF